MSDFVELETSLEEWTYSSLPTKVICALYGDELEVMVHLLATNVRRVPDVITIEQWLAEVQASTVEQLAIDACLKWSMDCCVTGTSKKHGLISATCLYRGEQTT